MTMDFLASVGRANTLDGDLCSVQGCSAVATAVLSSAWYPEFQWILCDQCQWNVDLNNLVASSDENKIPGCTKRNTVINKSRATILGTSRSGVPEFKKNATRILQDTTLPSNNHDKHRINNSFKKHDTKTTLPTTWCQFEKVLSLRKLAGCRRTKKCNADGCDLAACSVWSAWTQNTGSTHNRATRTLWYVCVDCQEQKFGGWPNVHDLLGKGYMTSEKLAIIATRCSKQRDPVLPPAFVKHLG